MRASVYGVVGTSPSKLCYHAISALKVELIAIEFAINIQRIPTILYIINNWLIIIAIINSSKLFATLG